MKSNSIDIITENLFRVFPLINRQLLRIDLNVDNIFISRPHFAIMNVLDELGAVPVSTVGKRLVIAKPQMTRLVDSLIDLAIVERQPDIEDRRVIKVVLTDKGYRILEQCRRLIRKNVRKKLSCLKDEDIEELLVSLIKIKDIGAKIG
jgi:DNA-binding MarR family transcriptional regulator